MMRNGNGCFVIGGVVYCKQQEAIEVLNLHINDIRGYIVCHHDTDEPHCHIMVSLLRRFEPIQIEKWFDDYAEKIDIPLVAFFDQVCDPVAYRRYLGDDVISYGY